MYKTPDKLDLPAIDREILDFWSKEEIFKKSIEQRPAERHFVFYEGPPSANGKPGIHHVMARSIKDLFCRYRSMKGYRVERKAGWDTHGLPIELAVEKELGITKEDIGKKISIEEYNKKCRETVMRYKDVWDELTVKMGYWVDLDHPYITFTNDYIESVWFLLKKLYDQGLMYKGYTIQPYSPAAGTGLSSHELNQVGTYREVKDTTLVAQFKVIRDEKSEFLFEGVEEGSVYFIAWTTTPWTLPSNTALAVGPKIEYARVKTYNPYTFEPVHLILAKELVGRWFKPEQAELDWEAYTPGEKPIPYRITGSYSGEELVGIRYEQLMPYAQPEEGDAFVVLPGDFVSTEEGTGIVHIAPSFGADDKRVAEQHGVGALTLVDKQGKFVDAVTDYAGRYVKDYKDEGEAYQNVDIDIAVQLKKENKAFNVQKHAHNYPHCWRTDKPILYYPLDSWFIRASAKRERMYELNKSINWKPPATGEGRFGKWLENVLDWNLSRSRFWGIPLPIWRNADGSKEICIGSLEQLQREIERANEVLGLRQTIPEDLHRPYIDQLVLVSEDGEKLQREPDLIDVWFDSGSMPYAQWHYPFENREKFKQNFPADFISEGVDQTRGWFYSLHAIAVMCFDSIAYKTVISTGLVQDKYGRKMSKRLGNAIDPFETLSKYGADATRWHMMTNAQPWDNLRFDLDGLDEVRRKFFGTLYNTYSFFALYANIDQFCYREGEIDPAERPEIDRWILSSLNSLIKEVDALMESYDSTPAMRKVQAFVEDQLSNWYVRLSRRRFWKGEMSRDKLSAYQTLYTCLTTVAKLMAPVAPFFADWLYKNLNEVTEKEPHLSVHLADYPTASEGFIDRALEERMAYAQKISSLVLSLRKREKLRVRQPLQRILLPILDDRFEAQVEAVKDLILSETNIKDIEYVKDSSGLLKKSAKPNFKTLGRRLGKQMKQAAAIISALSTEEINRIEQEGKYLLEIDGQVHELGPEDFDIRAEDIPGWLVASDGRLVVALDITLTDELLAEGMARELVNRIQNLRKQKGLEVTDHIKLQIEKKPELERTFKLFGDYICSETLADELELIEGLKDGEEVQLPDEIDLHILVEKA